MTYEELQRLFDRVVTGITIVEDRGKFYFVHDPLPFNRLLAEIRYKKVMDDLSVDGFTQAQTSVILASRNIWNPEKEAEVKEIQRRLGLLQDELKLCEFQSKKKQMISDEIQRLNARYRVLTSRKNAMSSSTVEYLATIEKYKTFVFLLTFDEHNKRIWTDWNTFIRDEDQLITTLMHEAFFNKEFDEAKLRELARTEPWRSSWVAARKCGRLFDKPLSQLTDLQRVVVGWSIVYDSVYEHPDCPPDDVISNDALLDAWLKEQAEKRKSRHTENSVEKTISSNAKIANSSEIGIVVDSPEDAMRVYKLNDPSTLNKLEKRSRALQEKGVLHEGQMPDTKFDLAIRKSKLESEGIKTRKR
jgi:hypothetical protein